MKHLQLFEKFENTDLSKAKAILGSTWFEHDNESTTSVTYATRDNGNIGDEKPGSKDIVEAKRLGRLVKEQCPDLNVTIENIDEWVNITVSAKKPEPAKRWWFCKHENEIRSAGFRTSFETPEELVNKMVGFIPMDRVEAKKAVDEATDKWTLVSKKGTGKNTWGYNFSIMVGVKPEI